MLVRYHWGHAVGHVYTHQRQCTDTGMIWSDTNHSRDSLDQAAMEELHEPSQMDVDFGSGSGTDRSDSDLEDKDWKPSDTDSNYNKSSDDEYILDMDEMYGEGGSEDGCE